MKQRMVMVPLIIVTVCIPLWAQSEADFTVILNRTGDGMVITGYVGNERDVVIPATIQGIPVREIGRCSFGGEPDEVSGYPRDGTPITTIVIPEGVTNINSYAFAGCSLLTSVSLPSTIMIIDGSAFFMCVELTTVTIPKSVERINFRDVRIGGGVSSAFFNCIRLSPATQSALRRVGYTEDFQKNLYYP